jgi:D-alanyl-D-alanine carboxypeptidase (penicillin-binding protein 5/6)
MNKCKKIPRMILLGLALALLAAPAAEALEDPDVGAQAIVLVDMNGNQILFSRNADARAYPASLTKLMTALLAAEAVEAGRVSLYDSVTASEDCAFDLTPDSSTAHIAPGEIMTLQDLLYCALVASANEACNIIAEYISGSIHAFVEEMNARAAELGCTQTHFTNTHGLPDENQYTTAGDFSLIAREAAASSLIMEICNTVHYTVPATNLSEERRLSSTNALINPDSMYSDAYVYEYARGIKTGYTSEAGYCLVSTAAKDGISLLAVVMGAKSEGEGDDIAYGNFSDTITLYEWVFNNFSYRDILKSTDQVREIPVSMGSDTDKVVLRPASSITALLPNDEELSNFTIETTVYCEQENRELQAPISAGEVLGEVTVSKNGVVYGTAKLVAGANVELSRLQYMKAQLYGTIRKPVVTLVLWLLVILLAVYILLVVRYRILYRRYRREALAAKLAREGKAAGMPGAAPAEEQKKPAQKPLVYERFSMPEPQEKKQAPPSENGEAGTASADRDYFEEFFGRKK